MYFNLAQPHLTLTIGYLLLVMVVVEMVVVEVVEVVVVVWWWYKNNCNDFSESEVGWQVTEHEGG